MKVAILGCGAMGTVIGAYLTKNGCSVEMIDNYEAHVTAMREKGAHVIGTVDFTIPVHAITPDQMSGIYDVVFLLTKQTANPVVLPHLLEFLGPDSVVCTLQNGVPEPSVAGYVGEERTVGGTMLWGATFIRPGVSELTQDITKSDHLFELGQIDGKIDPKLKRAADVLGRMGPIKLTNTLMASRWGKLVSNACMSGMSAVCGCTFNDVLENPKARACLSYIGREVRQCCEAAGYKLPTLLSSQPPDSLNFDNQERFRESQIMFMRMYDGLRPAKASMLQDLEKGFRCEVRMINGFVCDTGDTHGIETPFNDVAVDVISKIERGELPLSMDNLKFFDDKLFAYKLYKSSELDWR